MSDAQALLRSLAGEDEWARHSTLEELRTKGFDGDLSPLREALADDDDPRRRNAARMALAALAHPTSPDPKRPLELLTDALGSPEEDLRTMAAVALGEAGNGGAVASLIPVLGDPDPNVAAAAAEALGALENAAAIDPLIEVARSQQGFWVKAAAVAALGKIQDVRGLPGIASAAGAAELESPVVEALRSIGHPDALPILQGMRGRGSMGPLLTAGSLLSAHPEVPAPEWVREDARDREQALRSLLEEREDTAVARLLGLTGTESALDFLLGLVAAPRRSEAALAGILAVPPPTRADAILDRVPDADTDECIALLSLLPPLESEARISRLVPLLDHPRPTVRAAAAESLARAPAEHALPLLSHHLDRTPLVPEVLRAMGGLGGTVCHALLPLLDDGEPRVRTAAAEALTRCASGDVAPRLSAVLEREESPEARRALLRAYGRAAGAEAVPVLAAALEDADEAMRLAAIEALGATGDASALPYLKAVTGHSAPESLAALRAVGEIAGPGAAEVLEPWLDSEDLDTRRSAASAAIAVPETLGAGSVDRLSRDTDPWVRVCAARILAGRPGDRARLEEMARSDASATVRDEARRVLARER